MIKKLIRFIIAFLIYAGMYALILYFFDSFKNDFSYWGQVLFFGLAMAIFDLLTLSRININRNEHQKRTTRCR